MSHKLRCPEGQAYGLCTMRSRLYLRQQGMVGIRVKWKKHTLSEQGKNILCQNKVPMSQLQLLVAMWVIRPSVSDLLIF